jgi:hypothetical protein
VAAVLTNWSSYAREEKTMFSWFTLVAAIFVAKVQYSNGFNVRDLLVCTGMVLPGLIADRRRHHHSLAICVLNTVMIVALALAGRNAWGPGAKLADVLFLNAVFYLSVIVWPIAVVWACLPVQRQVPQ